MQTRRHLPLAVAISSGVLACALVACALLFAFQSYETRERERMACFKAFLDNHYVGLVFAVGLLMDRIALAVM